jgi:DNA-3-methyladenine glycosylase
MKAIISPSSTYSEEFYARPTVKVAKDLLGCYLNRRLPSGIVLSAEISEVEAYTANDPACHAFRGKTKRTEVLFGPAGRAYVYFIYGMYYCLNVVTEADGIPGAVLIRGLHGKSSSGANLNGPGKICKHWDIDKSQNGISLTDPNSELWISPIAKGHKRKILISQRIGISQAQEKLWRFYTINETTK